MEVDRRIANLDDEVAMPRNNGELVFNSPWEGRAFGMAVVLTENGTYAWGDFRQHLVARVAAGGRDYYVSWLGALEAVLAAGGVLSAHEVEARAAEYRTLERDPVL